MPSRATHRDHKSAEHLPSEFAGDPDMDELLEFFLGELKDRIGAMLAALETEDHPRLRRMAHQLKGAAGGYGYPSITSAAADLESALGAEPADQASVNRLTQTLVALCRRASDTPHA